MVVSTRKMVIDQLSRTRLDDCFRTKENMISNLKNSFFIFQSLHHMTSLAVKELKDAPCPKKSTLELKKN